MAKAAFHIQVVQRDGPVAFYVLDVVTENPVPIEADHLDAEMDQGPEVGAERAVTHDHDHARHDQSCHRHEHGAQA